MKYISWIKKQPFVYHTYYAIYSFFKYYELLKQFALFNHDKSTASLKDLYPIFLDNTSEHGYDHHYIFHTSWAARVVKQLNPKKHVDISSSLYFSGILSAFIPVDFYDYRPAFIPLSNLKSDSADLTKLKFKSNSIDSISCMHTVEHIGLGRYGDPIDAEGDIKAMKELQRVTKKGGSLLFVVPVGKPKVMFNAHRIYSYESIAKTFDMMKVEEFTLIPDNHKKGLVINASPKLVAKQDYAAGCFWFIKK